MIRIKQVIQLLRGSIYLVGILLVLVSCQKEMDKYYELPGWLKGNSWEILNNRGNYTIFLSAIEKTGLKELVNGNGLVTIIAPNDDAFKEYLSSKGYSSINDIPEKELDKLISYHLLYYSFTKAMFINYQPDGVESKGIETAGLYYKFRTRSKDENTTEFDFGYNKERIIYHKERFIPVFSYQLFKTKGIDAKSNYEYFYPSSTWSGGSDGCNISNASVKEYAIIADNGYIYDVDKVIEPLETIYEELKKSTDFSDFRNMYDRFAYYSLDEDMTSEFGKGDTLYLKFHRFLPEISSEWTSNGTSLNYADLGILSGVAFNIFAPNNTAIENFYQSFWSPYYTSLNKVNYLPLWYLLRNHVYQGSVVFPEEIEKGFIKSSYATTISFNRNTAVKRQMCVNGTFYGIDHVLEPDMFKSVTGPAFRDPQFNIFLMMADGASLIEPLMTDQAKFQLYLPSDSMIVNDYTRVRNGDNKSADIRYINTNPNISFFDYLQVYALEDYTDMSFNIMDIFVRNHVVTGKISQIGNDAIYRTLNKFNYLYFRNDTVFSSGIFNRKEKGPTYTLLSGTQSNGETYKLNGDVSALTPEYNLFKEVMLRNPLICPDEFAQFREKVIQKAGMDITSPPFSFLQGERFIVFIPSNDFQTEMNAITAANAPEYAKYYFVNVSASNLSDYPFPGAGIAGTLKTFKTDASGNAKTLTLIDTGTGLKVRDEMNNEVEVIGVFPRIYDDGAAYLIKGLLKYE